MKKILIIALVLFMMFTPYKPSPSVLDFSVEDLEAYGIAGAMMMVAPVSADDLVPLPKPDVAKDCKCKNGKVSYDGGTSFSDCPCITSGGKCACDHATESVIIEEVIPRTVLITQPYFEGRPNCPPCIRVENEIVAKLKNDTHKARGWDVGSKATDDFQILDLNDSAAVEEINRLSLDYLAVPTFYLLGKEGVKKHEGYMSYDQYMTWIKQSPKSSQPYVRKSTTPRWSLNGTFNPSKESLVQALKTEPSVKRNLADLSIDDLIGIYNDVRNGVYSE